MDAWMVRWNELLPHACGELWNTGGHVSSWLAEENHGLSENNLFCLDIYRHCETKWLRNTGATIVIFICCPPPTNIVSSCSVILIWRKPISGKDVQFFSHLNNKDHLGRRGKEGEAGARRGEGLACLSNDTHLLLSPCLLFVLDSRLIPAHLILWTTLKGR